MKKPVIGITLSYQPGKEVAFGEAVFQNDNMNHYTAYAVSVANAGGIPVFIPRLANLDQMHEMIDALDGVILVGGEDVDPASYGEEKKETCGETIPERDVYDIDVARTALAMKKPMVGICRGSQILNVAFGGTLHQDIYTEGYPDHAKVSYDPDGKVNLPFHFVYLEKGSILNGVLGDKTWTDGGHHQALKDIAPNGKVLGRTDDGCVEYTEYSGGHPFTMGIQWHPEMQQNFPEQQLIFKAFVEACAKD